MIDEHHAAESTPESENDSRKNRASPACLTHQQVAKTMAVNWSPLPGSAGLAHDPRSDGRLRGPTRGGAKIGGGF